MKYLAMFTPVLCRNFKYIFLARGRMIFASAQCSQSLQTLFITSPTTTDSDTTARNFHFMKAKKVEISAVSFQRHEIIRRQIQIKSSQTHKLIPQYFWDKVSPDFLLVYENDIKNWIWSYYVSQILFGATSCWFFGHKLIKHLEVLPDGGLQTIIAGYCILTLFFLSGNFWFRNVFIRIYYNDQSDQFVAVRRSCFGRLEKIYYNPADVVLIGKPKDNIDVRSMVKIRGRKCYLLSASFVSPKYYNMHKEGERLATSEGKNSYVRTPKF